MQQKKNMSKRLKQRAAEQKHTHTHTHRYINRAFVEMMRSGVFRIRLVGSDPVRVAFKAYVCFIGFEFFALICKPYFVKLVSSE